MENVEIAGSERVHNDIKVSPGDVVVLTNKALVEVPSVSTWPIQKISWFQW
jgi:hypothetical protein